jgi:hypothetical protein
LIRGEDKGRAGEGWGRGEERRGSEWPLMVTAGVVCVLRGERGGVGRREVQGQRGRLLSWNTTKGHTPVLGGAQQVRAGTRVWKRGERGNRECRGVGGKGRGEKMVHTQGGGLYFVAPDR